MSDNGIIEKERKYGMRMVFTCVGIALGVVGYSYAGSIIGTTLGQPSFLEYMGLATNPNATGLIGTMTGLFYAGGVFGCILNAYLADKIGRKLTIMTGAIILTIGTACLSGSVNVAMFIVFRFFVGMGAYMLFLTAPLWVTEIVPPKDRSVLCGICGFMGVVGYIIAAYVGVGFFYYKSTSNSQWRAPLALGCFPPVALLCVLPFLPESPRWLLSKGRTDEALAIVKKLHSSRHDPDHEYAIAEFFQMKKQNELDSSLDSSWLEILRRPSYRKRALIAFMLPVILYTTGNLVITTYAASLFASLGYDAGQSLLLLAGLYLCCIVGNGLSLTYAERVPRNIMLGTGVVVVTCILSIETGLLASYLPSIAAGKPDKSGLAAAAAFIFLFLFGFNCFLEGPSFYYVSELFPTHLRAKGQCINVVAFCLIDILWLEIAPTAITQISWKYYLVFICLSVPGALYIFFRFPNTLGLPLEEVARLFGDDDLVAVYSANVHVDHTSHQVIESEGAGAIRHGYQEKSGIEMNEFANASPSTSSLQ